MGLPCRKELEGELQGACKARDAALARANKLEADLQVIKFMPSGLRANERAHLRGCAR